MKTTVTITIFLLLASHLSAQQYFHWTSKAGGESNDYVNSIVCPANNKIYVAGGFVNSICADNVEASGYGMRDIFLACYNAEGNAEWIKTMGGINPDNVTRLAVGEKCIYMAGVVSGDVSMGKKNFNGQGKSLFVASWSLKGKINWLKRFDYTSILTSDVLKVGGNGKIITGGMFLGKMLTNKKTVNSSGKKRAYVLELSPEGNLIKSVISTGEGEHRFVSATFNAKNESYYLFSTTGKFDFGSQPEIYPEIGKKTGLLLLKNNNAGIPEWARFIEGSGYTEGVRLASPGEGTFVCANFSKQLTTQDTALHTNSDLAVALLKYTDKGERCWGEVIQGPSRCRAMDAMCNKTGKLLVTGYYKDGYKVQQTEIVSENTSGNIFLLQFGEEGKVIWHNEPGDNAPNFSKSFTISQTGDILLAGGFKGELELEGEKLESAGSTDILIVKYFNCAQLETKIADPGPICQGETTELNASGSFESYCWNGTDWGNTYEIPGPGTYFVHAYDERGCAASDTLEIVEATSVSLGLPEELVVDPGQEEMLEATLGFLNYTWSDGETGNIRMIAYKQLTDSLQLFLTATSMQGCAVHDSTLIRFTKAKSGPDRLLSQALTVYPNPVNDYTYWHMQLKQDKVTYSLTNGSGELIIQDEILNYLPGTRQAIDMKMLASGSYLLTISFGDRVLTQKIIKR